MDGLVRLEDFNSLIEASATIVRKLNLAPSTNVMYKSVQDRDDARRKMFDKMDQNTNHTITFDEYLTFTRMHIQQKLELHARNSMNVE